MMALSDPSEIEILRGKIEVAEMGGRSAMAAELRRQLDEMLSERAYDVDAADDSPADGLPADGDIRETSTLLAFRRDRRKMVRFWITKLDDLANWNVRRFRAAGFTQAEIERIYAVDAALETNVIGSGDVPIGVPDPNPYAIDLLDGRTVEDVSRLLDGMARGELTQRRASIEAGTSEEEQEYGYAHQRAGSMIDRHSCYYAGSCLRALKEEHKHAIWLKGVSIEKFDVKKRPWGLRIELRVSEEEAMRILKVSPNPVHGGVSWRGCRVVFVEGK